MKQKKVFRVIGIKLIEDTKLMARQMENGLNELQQNGYDIKIIENDSGILIVGSDREEFERGEDADECCESCAKERANNVN